MVNTPSNMNSQKLINTAGIVVLAAFSAIVLYNSAYVSMSYDDSYNASVAKNLSLGLGYVSTYDTIKPFDVKVTTGPTLLVPAALMMRVFGNTSWAPNVATAIVTLAMLALLLYCASRRMQISFGLLALSCVPPLTILAHLADGWNRLRGDVLAAELVVLGALILPFEPASGGGRAARLRRIVTAGVVLGLAALTKFLAFACIAAIAIVFVAGLLAQNNRRYREGGFALLALGAGVMIPNALFEIMRFVSLGGLSGYVENLFATLISNAEQEPSIARILLGRFDFAECCAKIAGAVGVWWNYVGFTRHPIAGSLLLLGWALSSAWGLAVARLANRLRLVAMAIAGGGLMVLFFAVFTIPFPTRVQLGACVLSLFVGLATAEWANVTLSKREHTTERLPYRYSPAFPLMLIAMFSVFWLVSFSRSSRPVWAAERASVVAASEVMLAIRANDPNAAFCGLGWIVPRVLEYALPGTQWFRDCRSLLEEPGNATRAETDPDAKVCELGGSIVPRVLKDTCRRLFDEPVSRMENLGVSYLVREPWMFDWLGDAADREFAGQCDLHAVHNSEGFVISRCPARAVFKASASD